MITWKSVPGYEGLYEVSDAGQVRGLDRIRLDGKRVRARLLRQTVSPKGYARVHLSKNANRKKRFVHQLVLEAFVGPRPAGAAMGCHKNGKSLENWRDNLRWGTAVNNAEDRRSHGTTAIGERSPRAKLTAEKVLAVRAYEDSDLSASQIGKLFGIGRSQVDRIIKRQTWRHLNG